MERNTPDAQGVEVEAQAPTDTPVEAPKAPSILDQATAVVAFATLTDQGVEVDTKSLDRYVRPLSMATREKLIAAIVRKAPAFAGSLADAIDAAPTGPDPTAKVAGTVEVAAKRFAALVAVAVRDTPDAVAAALGLDALGPDLIATFVAAALVAGLDPATLDLDAAPKASTSTGGATRTVRTYDAAKVVGQTFNTPRGNAVEVVRDAAGLVGFKTADGRVFATPGPARQHADGRTDARNAWDCLKNTNGTLGSLTRTA